METAVSLDLSGEGSGLEFALRKLCGIPTIARLLMDLEAAGVRRIAIHLDLSRAAPLREAVAKDGRVGAELTWSDAPPADLPATPGPAPQVISSLGLLGKGDRSFMPIRTGEEFQAARKALMRTVLKSVEDDGVVCYYISRRISLAITRLLLPLPLTPNQATVVAFLLGCAAAWCVALGEWGWMVLGAALFQASTIFDNVDGEIARLKRIFSPWGEWLDTLSDDLTNMFFMLGMGIGLAKYSGCDAYLFGGIFMFAELALYNGVIYHYLLTRTRSGNVMLYKWWFDLAAPRQTKPVRSGVEALVSKLKYLGRRDFFIAFILVCALADLLAVAFWALVVGTVLNLVLLSLQLTWHKKKVYG